MEKIHINASKEYDVYVEKGLLNNAAEYIKTIEGIKKAIIISDDKVFGLYGDGLKNAISDAGIEIIEFVFPNGEKSKNISTYSDIVNFMCEQHMTRSDIAIALGGGVVGDIAGFAAATYQRGIKYIQIPTTLLAAVDSSVGGKTAIDLASGKNQVGCFYQPAMVLCDPETFNTLLDEEFSCGCAEVIKYAVYGNKDFFEDIKNKNIKEQIEHVIATCVKMKKQIVEEDEFDTGKRMLLNFGHTIGHAVEACSNFNLLHGEGVAIGMVAIAKIACERGICGEDVVAQLEAILKEYNLPTETSFSANELMDAIYNDKKLAGDTLRIVIPKQIGECTIESVPVDSLKQMLVDAGY